MRKVSSPTENKLEVEKKSALISVLFCANQREHLKNS